MTTKIKSLLSLKQRQDLMHGFPSELPADYRKFVAEVGYGRFSNDLYVFHPAAPTFFSFWYHTLCVRFLYRTLNSGAELPYREDQLYAWACSIDGQYLLYVNDYVVADEWPMIIVDNGIAEFQPLTGTCAEVIENLLQGTVPGLGWCPELPPAEWVLDPTIPSHEIGSWR